MKARLESVRPGERSQEIRGIWDKKAYDMINVQSKARIGKYVIYSVVRLKRFVDDRHGARWQKIYGGWRCETLMSIDVRSAKDERVQFENVFPKIRNELYELLESWAREGGI